MQGAGLRVQGAGGGRPAASNRPCTQVVGVRRHRLHIYLTFARHTYHLDTILPRMHIPSYSLLVPCTACILPVPVLIPVLTEYLPCTRGRSCSTPPRPPRLPPPAPRHTAAPPAGVCGYRHVIGTRVRGCHAVSTHSIAALQAHAATMQHQANGPTRARPQCVCGHNTSH